MPLSASVVTNSRLSDISEREMFH